MSRQVYKGFPCPAKDAAGGPSVPTATGHASGLNKKRKSRGSASDLIHTTKVKKRTTGTRQRCRDIRSFLPSYPSSAPPRNMIVHGSLVIDPIDLTEDTGPITLSAPAHLEASTGPAAVCICGRAGLEPDELVHCAGEDCEIRLYHKACVGLANKFKYQDNSKWQCRACRPPPPMSGPIPATSVASADSIRLAPGQHAPMQRNDPEPPLHAQQAKVVDCIDQGHCVFYTGSAGTGKSTVLKASVKGLRAQGKTVDVVAPSGIAALAIGGSTIFSYAGWYPNVFKLGLAAVVQKAFSSKSVRRRLCRTDVLFIDEISMVESDMLTGLDTIMRAVRHGWKPERGERRTQSPHDSKLAFGGAQVVVTGDFCQLPPVKAHSVCLYCGGGELVGTPKQCNGCKRIFHDRDKWAFRSPAWDASEFTCFELKRVHRQRDAQFISLLQKCRVGEVLQRSERELLLRKKRNMDNAVKLLPQKGEVNRKNQEGFRVLPGSSRMYDCLDHFDWRNKNELDLKDKGKPLNAQRPDGPMAALRDHRFEDRIELKIGMLVILLVNLDLEAGLVNGSQGKIVRFDRYDPSSFLAEMPSSLPSRGLEGSKRSDPASDFAAMKENHTRQFIERAPHREWPVVEFNNGTTRTIYAHCQTTELGSEKPYSILARTQIPLVAAWAITIHKSQGMSLDRVSVDLYNSFEKEMVYVALSRARRLEGLEVIRMPGQMKQGMNAEVAQFLKAHVWRGT